VARMAIGAPETAETEAAAADTAIARIQFLLIEGPREWRGRLSAARLSEQ
jgi:hypothetical protein